MIDTATLQAFAAFLAVWVAALGLLAGFVYWHFRDMKEEFRTEMHRLENRTDHSNAELVTELRRLDDKLDRSHAELVTEIRRTREELLAEIRRANVQLLTALNGHTYDTETGAPVFRELPAADDD